MDTYTVLIVANVQDCTCAVMVVYCRTIGEKLIMSTERCKKSAQTVEKFCRMCYSSGHRPFQDIDGSWKTEPCPRCNGTGWVLEKVDY